MNTEKNTTNIMKEHENVIEAARGEIQSLMEQQNLTYQRLVDEVVPAPEQEGWLWDYCFNCGMGDNDGYLKNVKENIYGGDQ